MRSVPAATITRLTSVAPRTSLAASTWKQTVVTATVVAEHYAGLPAGDYPMIAAMGAQLMVGSGEQRARWAVQVLLNGILATPVG